MCEWSGKFSFPQDGLIWHHWNQWLKKCLILSAHIKLLLLIKGLKGKQSLVFLFFFSTNGCRGPSVITSHISKPKIAQGSEVYVENPSLKAHYPPTAT